MVQKLQTTIYSITSTYKLCMVISARGSKRIIHPPSTLEQVYDHLRQSLLPATEPHLVRTLRNQESSRNPLLQFSTDVSCKLVSITGVAEFVRIILLLVQVRATVGEAGALSLTEPTEGTDFGVRDGVQGTELGNPTPAPTNARDVQPGAVGGMMAAASEDFCQFSDTLAEAAPRLFDARARPSTQNRHCASYLHHLPPTYI